MDHIDITSLASAFNFRPTRKKATPYTYAESAGLVEPGSLPPYSYTQVIIAQEVVTITADGVETANTATPGDFIVSGVSGELYVVKASKFAALYDGEVGETVVPTQAPRQVARYGEVTFTAPWGEEMVLKPGDYLVADGDGGFYRIAAEEFHATYNIPAEDA